MGRDQAPVITGFGTSKMGVARQLSSQAEAGRLAVKVNEFGKLRVDSELLRECDDGEHWRDEARDAGARDLALNAGLPEIDGQSCPKRIYSRRCLVATQRPGLIFSVTGRSPTASPLSAG